MSNPKYKEKYLQAQMLVDLSQAEIYHLRDIIKLKNEHIADLQKLIGGEGTQENDLEM